MNKNRGKQAYPSILLRLIVRIPPKGLLDRLGPDIPDLFRTALLSLVSFILCLIKLLDTLFSFMIGQSLDTHAEPKGIPIVRAAFQFAVAVDVVELAA